MQVVEELRLESHIEEALARELVKHVHPEAQLAVQVEFTTIGGDFRVDFVLSRDGRTVGIECDGKDFHDKYRDEWRDALLLGDHRLDAMYRLRGCDIWHNTGDLILLIAQREPQMFSPRGHINLEALAHPEVRAHEWQDRTSQTVYLRDGDDFHEIRVLCRLRAELLKGRSFLRQLYQDSVLHPGMPYDQLQDQLRKDQESRSDLPF
jgi:very-short-patch-repair endonuclease